MNNAGFFRYGDATGGFWLDSPHIGTLPDALNAGKSPLLFPALGARPITAVFQHMPEVSVDAQGRVVIDAWLRPARSRRVFALGDAAATDAPVTIVAITRQVPWLAKTIAATLAGKAPESLPAYVPSSSRGILVPLGPRDGASVLPLMREGVLVGKWTTALIKGRELFIPRYRKEFGYAKESA